LTLNAARRRSFRINIGEPLQRLDVAANEHLKISDACLGRNGELAAKRLAQHIEISREHTLGIRPMRRTAGRPAINPQANRWDHATSDGRMLSSLQKRPTIRNGLLTVLSLQDFDPVRAFLQPVTLK
jgi:hypothetical protein